MPRCLRRFEYSRALDLVLKPYVTRTQPQHTYAVLAELRRRRVLRRAIAGRAEKGLAPLITFTARNVADSNRSELLIDVANKIIGEGGNEGETGKKSELLGLGFRCQEGVEKRGEYGLDCFGICL